MHKFQNIKSKLADDIRNSPSPKKTPIKDGARRMMNPSYSNPSILASPLASPVRFNEA